MMRTLRENNLSLIITFTALNSALNITSKKISNYKVITYDFNERKQLLQKLITIESSDKFIGLFSTPSALIDFLDYTNRKKFYNVRYIRFSGEFFSNSQKKYLKTYFPKAKIYNHLGSAEAGAVGYQCSELAEKDTNLFHPYIDSNYIEIDHENMGEILITNLLNPNIKPLQLRRYKTNDFGEWTENICNCGNEYTFKLLGRGNHDYIRFSGVTLYTDLIDETIYSFDPDVSSRGFEAHIRYINKKNTTKPQLEIIVFLKMDNEKKEKIKTHISRNLMLTGRRSYQDLVDMNVFEPLKVSESKKKTGLKKRRHLYLHQD